MSRPRIRHTRQRRTTERPPVRWYSNSTNQAAAELIAHHYAIDSLVGLPLDTDSLLEREPYSSFDPAAVSSFITRLVAHLTHQPPKLTHHA